LFTIMPSSHINRKSGLLLELAHTNAAEINIGSARTTKGGLATLAERKSRSHIRSKMLLGLLRNNWHRL